MRWAFRVATQINSGSGHITRSSALAQALPPPVSLFVDPNPAPNVWPGELEPQVMAENNVRSMSQLIATCNRGDVQAVVIDSYSVNTREIGRLPKDVFTAAFRDFSDSGPERVSISINAPQSNEPTRICGLHYAPLSLRFVTLNERASSIPKFASTPNRVLVSFGQRDSANMTRLALEALAGLDQPPETTIVMGRRAAHTIDIKNLVRAWSWVKLENAVENIDELYFHHRLAIGAPGVSQLERACCGLPTILIPQNKEQAAIVRFWANDGIAFHAPKSVEGLTSKVKDCLKNPEGLGIVRARAIGMIDGRGAERLAERLQKRSEDIGL